MSGPLQFPCSNCGAHLWVDGSTQTPVCQYCHTQTLLPADVWSRFERKPAPQPAFDGAAAAAEIERSALKVVPAIVVAVVAAAVLGAIVVGVISFAAVSTTTSALSTVTPKSSSLTANAGEACGGRKVACSADGKAELHCGDGDKLVATLACKGPNGCRVATDKTSIDCDYTLADVKDPCDVDDGACSTDHKAELRCVGNRFAVANTCKGPDGCTLAPNGKGQGYTLTCDDHVADVGDPCAGPDRTACSSDKKSFLVCTQQRFVVEKSCKRGCTAKKLAGTGNVEMDCN